MSTKDGYRLIGSLDFLLAPDKIEDINSIMEVNLGDLVSDVAAILHIA
jgi:hypothetical protein